MKGTSWIYKKSAVILAAVLCPVLSVLTANATQDASAASVAAAAPKTDSAVKDSKNRPQTETAAACTVTFNPNGGTVTPTKGMTNESGALASLPVPLKNGYSFSGWFTDTAGGRQITSATAFGANTAVYARWALVTYKITFDANGGKGAEASGATGESGKLASLPAPTKAGYTFAGWYTALTGGAKVTSETVFSANAALYAHWALVTHTVTFDAKGGTVTPTTGTTGEGGTLASLPAPTRSGYNFKGWFTAAASGDSVTTSKTYSANATVYARWTPVTYTITFNAGGGEVSPKSGVTGEGWKLASLPTPARTGYTFEGWYTAAAGGDSVTLGRTYSANAAIYARWALVRYTVTFNAGGGKAASASSVTGEGWKLASLPTPTKTGYIFEGWQTAASGGAAVTADNTYSANTTIYARWTHVKHTVTFNANGGAVSPASSVTGNGWKLASLPKPVKNGYTFDGWFTAATGGAAVTTGKTYSANTTIYARWTLITYTVKFDANITGGKVTPASTTTGKGWKLASLPTPERDGYAFDGWFTAAAGGDSVTLNTAFSDNATLYARWKLTTSTIRFNTNGGTVIPAFVMTGDGRKLTSLPTPAREGYAFAGWFTAAADGEAVTVGKAFGADAVIYARWTLITYKVSFEPNITGGKVTPVSATTGDGWALASLPIPVRDGYAFDGWYTAQIGGTKVTTKTVFSENATIYARWVAA